MLTFPREVLSYMHLLDAIVLDTPEMIMIDPVNFPDAIAVSAMGDPPDVFAKLGLTVWTGTIPEIDQRPPFDARAVWLTVQIPNEPHRYCTGHHHVGPYERIPNTDQMDMCLACGARIGK